MKHDSMVEALRRNKAHALDITVTIGRPEDGQLLALNENGPDEGLMGADGESPDAEQERRDLDLAPNAEVLEDDGSAQHADEAQDKKLIQDELKQLPFFKKKPKQG